MVALPVKPGLYRETDKVDISVKTLVQVDFPMYALSEP